MKHFIGFLLRVCLLSLVVEQMGPTVRAGTNSLRIGDLPPLLKLTKSLQGPELAEISWAKLRGKVVVLEFWATWCGPCLRAIPHLNELSTRFKNEPVQFISVTDENEAIVRAFLQRQPMKSWVALEDYSEMKEAYGVRGIPQIFVVARQGKIAAITHPTLLKPEHIEEVLAGKACSLRAIPESNASANPLSESVTNRPPLYEISIRPSSNSKLSGPSNMWERQADHCGLTGERASVESALSSVFDVTGPRMRIAGSLPKGLYDFRLHVPPGMTNLLKTRFAEALRTAFGLEVKVKKQLVNAYRLRVFSAYAPGLRPGAKSGGGSGTYGGFKIKATSMSTIVGFLEDALRTPVIDDTGFTGNFDVDMKWEMSEAELLQNTVDQRILHALAKYPNTNALQSLPRELLTGKNGRQLSAVLAELKKPQREQFRPDPAAIMKAARERLGLELVPVKEFIEILEVKNAADR